MILMNPHETPLILIAFAMPGDVDVEWSPLALFKPGPTVHDFVDLLVQQTAPLGFSICAVRSDRPNVYDLNRQIVEVG
jgi:hypothetical protein